METFFYIPIMNKQRFLIIRLILKGVLNIMERWEREKTKYTGKISLLQLND